MGEILMERFLLVGILFLVGFLTVQLLAFVSEKIKKIEDIRVNTALSYLLTITEKVVGAINQEVVDELKTDNKFTKEEAEKVKNKALKEIDQILNEESKKLLQKHFDFNVLKEKSLEDEVRRQK